MVCALWLVERRICIRVCKHGCYVKMICFSPTNHASINWKRFWSENSTSLLYLLIHSSAETLKTFTNMLCQFFSHLSWHFKLEKSVFWKAYFLQNKNWLRVYKTLFFLRKVNFIKAIENFFLYLNSLI